MSIMQGGKHKQPLGYTIVEVMIFMAVSSFMFLLSATFISGKQSNVEFRQSMNDVNTQIQQIVNQVANGEYDPLVTYNCDASSTSQAPPSITVPFTVNAQGSNGGAGGCIFFGKVLQFGVGGVLDTYNTYTIAARQVDFNTGSPVQSFLGALPIVVDSSAGTYSVATLTKNAKLQHGLQFIKALLCPTAACTTGTPTGAVGFFGSFGGYTAASAGGQGAAQSVIIAPIPSSTSNETQAAMVSTMNSNIQTITSGISGGQFIKLCFVNGIKYGSVVLGNAGGQRFTTQLYTAGAGSTCP